jgi:hypothetical protein
MITPLDYAARGFAVFPCLERSKLPACSRGFKDATTNPATIRRWWGGHHNYNIGIATGVTSSVWVFDVDGGAGAAALRELEAKHSPLAPTLTSITAGGCHLWFGAEGALPCSVGRIGPGLDVRADGGYVLVPPSVHPDGPIYRWSNDRPPAVAPDWLIRLARHKPGAPAISIRPGGELAGADVEQNLIRACQVNGLLQDDGLRQVYATIRSGARAGLQFPRSRPERRT